MTRLILPTDEERACIEHCDSRALTDFYENNFLVIKRICYNHCKKGGCVEYVMDCLNQVYVDLPRYNFNNDKSLYWCIKKSCYKACMFSHIVSLNKPITEDGATLSDIIPDRRPSAEEKLEYDEHIQESVDNTIRVILEVLYKGIKAPEKADICKFIGYIYPSLTDEEINKYVNMWVSNYVSLCQSCNT